jgi:hypothetical protein
LKETLFDIYVIDSAHRPFEIKHPRFKQYNFAQEPNQTSSTKMEIISVRNLLQQFPQLNDTNYDMIFKVTGKYVLPHLNYLMKHVPVGTDVLVQHHVSHELGFQNTEYFAAKPSVFRFIFQQMTFDLFLEQGIYQILLDNHHQWQCYRMPPLTLDTRTPRGDNAILTYL